ncbi:DUF1189 family protein [Candidatus Peregrinibacteria bacterium]|nr:DUF1189 family protein [Candidatus Peregrinibacteria bacterium]MBT4631583.1 DUF1189 family protein [Candidatus Peregrinibacteria bacterium]MBT4890823.1 DUF1189 family protein [Rhodospirillales bacterium]MBT5517003.1 DUF1189 family protein [Candidatus Peregrinibacteria bacterium]MBT5824120.1 DUF1189 family protein [Candidatus Peregrinibacteria bacterium]
MKEFLTTIKQSIYSPKFYSSIVSQKGVSASLWYLLKLSMLVLSVYVIIGIIFLYIYSPKISEFINIPYDVYPEELELVFEDYKLSTNVEEPYFIGPNEPLPEEWNITYKDLEGEESHLFVIDTLVEVNTPIEGLLRYNTVMLMTGEYLYIFDGDTLSNVARYDEFDLINTENLVIDKPYMDKKITQMVVIICLVSLPILWFVFTLFVSCLLFLYLIIIALVSLCVAKIIGINLRCRQAFRVAIYGLTLEFLLLDVLYVLLTLFTPLYFLLPFYSGPLLSISVICLNLYRAKKLKLLK